ncbi:hypothetical protein PTKIN_Ptkin08bG0120400 [Pterospermum kingtungense]
MWIESPKAQGHATVFVAMLFGRAGLMSFISVVPEPQRPALFQSLLFKGCGKTVNLVNGAVGLLWTWNWHVCQAVVEIVLQGGTLREMFELIAQTPASDEASEATYTNMWKLQETITTTTNLNSSCRFSNSRSKVLPKRKRVEIVKNTRSSDLDLCLITARFTGKRLPDNRQSGSPYMNFDDSITTTCYESGFADQQGKGRGASNKLLNLFV